jgi:hypothetical protein
MNRKLVALAAASVLLLPVAAQAQERVGDAALGALSGAVVLGPVGAVAGAFVGYTAGPHIAGAWGVRHGRRAHQPRTARGTPSGVAVREPAPPAPAPAPAGATEPAPSAPVGVSAVNVVASPEPTSPAAAAAAPPPPAPSTSVPVQGFE